MRFLPPASALPTLLITPVWAAEFELHPTLSVAQYYSDNVALAPSGQEQSDWVTRAQPGFIFNYNGAKLKYHASVSADVLYRANEGGTESHLLFNGGTVGSMELVPQLLYFDTNSSATQQNTSVFAPQPLSNVNTSTNRATVWFTRLSPYLRYNFGSEASTLVRYTYSTVNSDIPAVRGDQSSSNRMDAQLTSGPAYKLTTWRVAYYYEKIDYTDARDTTAQSITATVRRAITPFFGLLANAGYENNDYLSTGATPKGSFWSVGVDWTPTPRTRLAATTGERFYGRTHSLIFSHRTRLTVWNATYSEEVTSYRQQVLVPTQTDTASYLDSLNISRIPDPVARQEAVQQFIAQSGLPPTLIVPVNFFTNQTFLAKTWNASAGLQGPRHTFLVNFFQTNTETQSVSLQGAAGDFATTSTVKQTGGGLVWNWRITAEDSSNASVGYNRTEAPSLNRQDDYKYFRVAYNHRFTPKMTGIVNYQHQKGDSNTVAGYAENQVSADLRMNF